MTSNKQERIAVHFKQILQLLDYDTRADGLKGTPARFARYITEQKERPPIKFTVFDESGSDELVMVDTIDWASACEHHTLPFYGTAIIGYIPNGSKIGGLSKFGRVVQHFAAGLNNQERITRCVGQFLSEHEELKPKAVGVILTAAHTCMSLRGVRCANARTTTQYLSGAFKTDPLARAEFLSAVARQTR